MVSTPSTGTERSNDGSGRTGLLGAAVAGFTAGAVGYLAFERRKAGASLPAGEDVRETAGEVRETVGESVPDAVPAGPFGREGETEPAGETDEAAADAELETPSTDRSDQELRERASEDAEAEPAEPGEMTVDEEVVEDLVEDDET